MVNAADIAKAKARAAKASNEINKKFPTDNQGTDSVSHDDELMEKRITRAKANRGEAKSNYNKAHKGGEEGITVPDDEAEAFIVRKGRRGKSGR